jgi:hypothetical protein
VLLGGAGFPNVPAANADSALQLSSRSLSIGESAPRFPSVSVRSRGMQHHASKAHEQAPFWLGLGTLTTAFSLELAGRNYQPVLRAGAVCGLKALAVPLLRYLVR